MANPIYLNANGSLDPTITDFFTAYASATIASGSITMTASAVQVDTQGGAAADDLDTIVAANAEAGTALFVRSTDPARVVTLKHRTGNLFCGGADIVLSDPQALVLLVYNGAVWVAIGGGGGATPIIFTEAEGQNRLCVIAQRVTLYLQYVISQAGDARAGGVLSVTAALLAALRLAQPGVNASAVNALALAIVTAYADEAAVTAAFTDTVWDNVRCALYCAHDDTGTQYDSSEVTAAIAVIDAISGTPYDVMADLIALLGADGLTRAVGLSSITSTTEDCDCDCVPITPEYPDCGTTVTINFTGGVPSYALVPASHPSYGRGAAGIYSSGVGRTAAGSFASQELSGEHVLQFEIDLGKECDVRQVSFWRRTAGVTGGNNFPLGLNMYDDAGASRFSDNTARPSTTAWEEWVFGAPTGTMATEVRYIVITCITLIELAPGYLDDIEIILA